MAIPRNRTNKSKNISILSDQSVDIVTGRQEIDRHKENIKLIANTDHEAFRKYARIKLASYILTHKCVRNQHKLFRYAIVVMALLLLSNTSTSIPFNFVASYCEL